jgi:hypothetical protein
VPNKMEEDAGVEKFGLLKLVKSSTAQSGWSGVRPGPKNKQGEFKWQAYLTVGGKKRGLKGLYEDPRDAAIQLAVKKQNLELTPDGAWSDEESDDAPSKPRAPRGALCLLVPFAFRVFTYTYIGSCELRLAFSLAGSKVKEAAAPLSALSTNILTRSRHPRALPAASTSLASPAVPAALCLATPPVLAAPLCMAQAVPLRQGDAGTDPACFGPGLPTCEALAWDPSAFDGRTLRHM